MQQAIGWVDTAKADAKWYVRIGDTTGPNTERSDIRFVGPGMDLTLHDIRGTDMPAPFDPKVHLNPAAFTIPQFNARIGRRVRDSGAAAASVDQRRMGPPEVQGAPHRPPGERRHRRRVIRPAPSIGHGATSTSSTPTA